ncbi:MAG: hypothetical protein Q9170_003811 [Blastenia crenularia]
MSGQHFEGYSWSNDYGSGAFLHDTREECIRLIKPTTLAEGHANISACILDRLTELDKALFSSRQYILTLWPAFVGAIVALAPDPSQMCYDNIWWSVLFAITCGGLPGLDGSSPPHHVEVLFETEGRSKCESWEYTIDKPKNMSKTQTMGNRTRGTSYIILEWFSFVLSFALYVWFIVYFMVTLRPAVNFIYYAIDWPRGAIWYLIGPAPAIAGAIFELLQNRVELFEPASSDHGTADQKGTSKDSQDLTSSAPIHSSPMYSEVKVNSVVMGNILFMPVPDDFQLFLLLLFTTAIPRQIWPGFWANGNRGADLVVFVKSIKMAE